MPFVEPSASENYKKGPTSSHVFVSWDNLVKRQAGSVMGQRLTDRILFFRQGHCTTLLRGNQINSLIAGQVIDNTEHEEREAVAELMPGIKVV